MARLPCVQIRKKTAAPARQRVRVSAPALPLPAPVDRDISLSLDPFAPLAPAATAVDAAPLPPPVELEPADLGDPLWRSLARHDLLLPLLRQTTIARAVQDVRLDEQERGQAQMVWARKYGIRSPEQLHDHLVARGIDEAEARWQAELPLRIQHHCEEHFSHRAEQRFLARKPQLDQVIYSLLRVEDAFLARELYLRIAEGEADFAELAATYSKGPEQATRGIVGPVPLLQAHPTLAERLRTSRPGELQPPLPIEQWWLVLRLESLRSASFDDEMRQRMARELFEEWVDEEVRRQIADHGRTP
jgi:parvulin-like peptidyl-prolyl isomerase